MSDSRKARGRETELLAAEYWRENGFPYAEAVRAGGRDMTGTGPVAPEVKARYGFNPIAWLKQARRNSHECDIPCVISRCNGQGPAAIDDWLVMTDHKTFMRLLQEAGYANTPTERNIP